MFCGQLCLTVGLTRSHLDELLLTDARTDECGHLGGRDRVAAAMLERLARALVSCHAWSAGVLGSLRILTGCDDIRRCFLAGLVVACHARTLRVRHDGWRHLHRFLERLGSDFARQIVVRRGERSRSHLLTVLRHVAGGAQGLLRVRAIAQHRKLELALG